ncbi:uncharacterized protein FTOL_08801 [Fusarium torulosum]|uniref:Uncharacterized protein n=1 Tax=Fusarium torulosum TaxID=33205 RepID=A0AAE8SKA4_9HYPO|nr:uncharacterized protein FTOL_08801 [Fusarium torulosum]
MGAVLSTLIGYDQSLKRCLPDAELSEPRPNEMVCRGFGASDLAFPGFAEMPELAEDSAVDHDTYNKFLQILQEQRTLREWLQQQIARAAEEALDNDRMDRLCQHFNRVMVLPPSPLTEDDLLSRHLDRAITMPSCPAMDLDELEDPAADKYKPECY